jgi:hypothetical protein
MIENIDERHSAGGEKFSIESKNLISIRSPWRASLTHLPDFFLCKQLSKITTSEHSIGLRRESEGKKERSLTQIEMLYQSVNIGKSRRSLAVNFFILFLSLKVALMTFEEKFLRFVPAVTVS